MPVEIIIAEIRPAEVQKLTTTMDVVIDRVHPWRDVLLSSAVDCGGSARAIEASQWKSAIDSGKSDWIVLVDGRATVTAADFPGLAQYLDSADTPIWLQPSLTSTAAERFVSENCPAAVAVCWSNPALYSMVCVRRASLSKIPPIPDGSTETLWNWFIQTAGRPKNFASACTFLTGEWFLRFEALADSVVQGETTSSTPQIGNLSSEQLRDLVANARESMPQRMESGRTISWPESKNAPPTFIAPSWESIPSLISHNSLPEKDWLIQHIEQTKPNHFIPDSAKASVADSVAIKAGLLLWHDASDSSHQLSQSIEGLGKHQAGDYWHAILHRREPDYSNAKYWFRQLHLHPVMSELIPYAARALQDVDNGTAWKSRLFGNGNWDPFAFVDLCAACADQEISPLGWAARQIQAAEMQLLMAMTYRDASGCH